MGVTYTGLAELQAVLQKAQDDAVEATKKVVGKGSLNVKKGAQRIIRAASHRGYLPHYPRAISYTVSAKGTVVTGEIGPDSAKLQGGLGRILEYGTVNNAPIRHLAPALDAEEPVLARYMEELGQALLEGWPVQGGPVVDPGGG
jgi:hypothetical protein